MRLPQVEAMTALNKTALYDLMKVGDFPRPIPIGSRARGWLVHEVAAWIEERAASRA
ncbi:MAG: AlpA family phage regulatory protein [Chromatiaceae bacterium]